MDTVLSLIGIIILALMATGLAANLYQRSRVPDRYAWLPLLSHAEWKPAFFMRREMERRTDSRLPLTIIYRDITELIEEELVEQRSVMVIFGSNAAIVCPGYRLTGNGLRLRYMNEREDPEVSVDAGLRPV